MNYFIKNNVFYWTKIAIYFTNNKQTHDNDLIE